MDNRKARLRLKLLYLPYERGGLQLPNLRWYYMASQLTAASYYFYTAVPPAWVNIEQESIPDLPLKLYLYSSDINTLKSTQKILLSKIQFQYGMLHISMWVTCQHCLNSCLFGVIHSSHPVRNMEYERHSENDGSLQRWRFAFLLSAVCEISNSKKKNTSSNTCSLNVICQKNPNR